MTRDRSVYPSPNNVKSRIKPQTHCSKNLCTESMHKESVHKKNMLNASKSIANVPNVPNQKECARKYTGGIKETNAIQIV